jgi:hypothetical protein
MKTQIVILVAAMTSCASTVERGGTQTASYVASSRAPASTNLFERLSPGEFNVATLTWQSGIGDFDAVLGNRTSGQVVNPRLERACYAAKFGVDPVSVCSEFKSGRTDYVYIVLESEGYFAEEKRAAFDAWKSAIAARLGASVPPDFHDGDSRLRWNLADGSSIRLTLEDDLRIDCYANP